MTRPRNHFGDPHLAPFALWNPLAAEGSAQALGNMLRNTSALVMLATSRTPAQWIMCELRRARPKGNTRGGVVPSAAKRPPQHGYS
jgi:hypothetical protein